MKAIKYIFFMSLLNTMCIGCNDDGAFDNKAFIDSTSKVSSVLLKSTVQSDERSFSVALAKMEDKDVVVHIKADVSLTETYNMAYYDQAEELPERFYTIQNPEVIISAGSVKSPEVSISFQNIDELDREQKYVLPVIIETDDIGVLQSARTIYYVFKSAALINVVADIEENNVYVNWQNPEVVTGMRKLTAEALIYVRNFDKMLSTLMGIEGKFLIRIGDAGIPSNQLQVATSNGNYTSSDLAIPTNEWVHIAVTYDADATEINVYINGKNLYTSTNANVGAVNWGVEHSDESDGKPRCFWIGYSYNNERYLAGMISECRIWNKVLTLNDINEKNHFYEVMPNAEGLVSYWKFDDGNGITITDYSENANHATASNSLVWANVELPENN